MCIRDRNIPQFERGLQSEFGISRNQLVNLYARHGLRRRLLSDQAKFEAGEIRDGFFFDKWFKEPALTPQEAGRFSLAKRKAKAAGQPAPTPSQALGKRPSPQETLRSKYDLTSAGDLQRAVESGRFSYEDFFKRELVTTQDPLDTTRVKKILSETLKSNAPDLDYNDLTVAFQSYRSGLRGEFRQQRKAINDWYDRMLGRARDLQLIDTTQTCLLYTSPSPRD